MPPGIQRQAGIKNGDRLEFQASPRSITITVSDPSCKPTRAELAAIRKGEAAIASGESVSLTDFLNGVDNHHRKTGAKRSRDISR